MKTADDNSLDDISKRISSSIDVDDKHSFTYGMKRTFTNIIDNEISPWLLTCFVRYSPEQFHKIMSENYYNFDEMTFRGFDFIGDWKKYHKKIFVAFKIAKRMSKYLEFDVDKIYKMIIDMLDEKGYNVKENEKMCIYHTLVKVYRMIFF